MQSIRAFLLLAVLYLYSSPGNAQAVPMYFTNADMGYFFGALVPSHDGGIIHFEPGLNVDAFVLTKLDSSGTFLWQKEINLGIAGFQAQTFLQLPDSGFLVAGCGANLSNIFIIRFDVNGDTLWSRKYNCNGSGTSINNLFLLSPTRVLLFGTTNSSSSQGALLMKFDIMGNADSATILDYPGLAYLFVGASTMNSDGQIVFCGTSPPGYGYFGIVDTNYTVLSLCQYQLSFSNFSFRKIAQHPDGSYYVVASLASFEDIYLLHMDSTGTVLHQNAFTAPTIGYNRGKDLLINSSGVIYLTCESTGNSPAAGAQIIRLNDTLGIENINSFIGHSPNGAFLKNDVPYINFQCYDQFLLVSARVYTSADSMGLIGCNNQTSTVSSLTPTTTTKTSFILTPAVVGIFPSSNCPLTISNYTLNFQNDFCLFNHTAEEALESEQNSIYPNPVTNIFQIESLNFDTYEILNSTGQVIGIGTTSATTLIDGSQLNAGIYFVRLIAESGSTSVLRFIKE